MGYNTDGGLILFDNYADIWDDPDDFLEEAIAELRITDAALASAPVLATSDPSLIWENFIAMMATEMKAELEKQGKP